MRRLLYLLSLLLAVSLVFPVLASPAAQTFDCNNVTEIPVTECQALMALYNSTNGPGWIDHTNWAMTNTPCSWYGVTCSSGHVTGLYRSANQLSGSVPPELGNLVNLSDLHLFFNQLSGSIPPELGNLPTLRFFDLSNNQLSGNIPPELGKLTNLWTLKLNDNQLSGSIPTQLGNLANLQELYLYNNQLSGNIPPEVGNFTNLRLLSLHSNQLSGSIPSELGNRTELMFLYLNNNRLSGSIPPELGNLVNLQNFQLSNNQLSGNIPAALVNLVRLTQTDLGYNMLSASDPALLAFLAIEDPDWMNTQTIPPGNVQVNGRILTWTPILYTGDSGHYVISLAQTQGGPYTLVTQVLGKNASSYDTGGLNLAYNTTYYFVVQSYTPAHGTQQNNLLSDYSQEIPVTIGSPPSTDCNSVTEIPVTECQALMALYNSTNGPGWIDHTNWATTTTPCSWDGVTCLEGRVTQINLNGNQLSGSIPPEIGNLTSLKQLYLNDNQLSGSIPPEIGNLTSLKQLYLDINQLSGSIPPEIGNLASLRYLYLSNNQLSGSIPPEIGNLTSLWVLFLYGNQLSGSIPPELGNLTNLGAFILSNNQLSGDIPTSLANLTGLGNDGTDLGYNRLTASDPALLAFLATKDSDWATTQTIPPANVRAIGAVLTWTPIAYTGDGGYYVVSYATQSGGPYTVAGQTTDKTVSDYTVAGLDYDTTYYFVVQSYTPTHRFQRNELTSDYSQEVSVTTSAANAIPQRGYYTTTTPTLTWNSVSWAAGYEIQVATDKTFSAVVYTKSDLTANELSVTAILPPGDGVYYWRVRAIRADKTPGQWSAVDSFMLDVAP